MGSIERRSFVVAENVSVVIITCCITEFLLGEIMAALLKLNRRDMERQELKSIVSDVRMESNLRVPCHLGFGIASSCVIEDSQDLIDAQQFSL
jgi:hypothetical protein